MSSSEQLPSATFPFRVRVTNRRGLPSDEARINIYDGRDHLIGESEGPIELQLRRGLYTVRVERAGTTWEKVLRHDGPTDETFPEPGRSSPTPVFDTATTHGYYAYTSAEWSGKDTRPPVMGQGKPNGRIFVFLRTLDASRYCQENLAEGLRLLDSSGAVLCSFNETETRRDSAGWLALSALAEPGAYLLRYDGDEPREMPLYIYQGRSTQLFISFQKGLRFETCVILMPPARESFNPEDQVAHAVDAALAGLQQGRDFVPRGPMRTLLQGKFENPMLGLLGVHVLLLSHPLRSEVNLDLLVGRLEELLPESPDVQALRLIAAERLGRPLPLQPFERPPMLRAGLEAVLRASGEHPEVVPEGSLIERVALRLRVDSPWSSWEPLVEVIEDARAYSIHQSFTISSIAKKGETTSDESDWLASYLKDAVHRAKRSARSLDLRRLASQLGVPARVIERTLSHLDIDDRSDVPSDDLTRIRGIGKVFEGVLNDMDYRTYNDLARIDQSNMNRLGVRLGRFASRPVTEHWVEQAKELSFRLEPVGKALKVMATNLEPEPDRRQQFRAQIAKVIDTFPGRLTWDIDLAQSADKYNWPAWAIECLPGLYIPVEHPSSDSDRALVWHYILACVPESQNYRVIAELCRGQLIDVEMSKEAHRLIKFIAPVFEQARLSNPYFSDRSMIGVVAAAMSQIEVQAISQGFPEAEEAIKKARRRILGRAGVEPDLDAIGEAVQRIAGWRVSMRNREDRIRILVNAAVRIYPRLDLKQQAKEKGWSQSAVALLRTVA